jgi:hypothetical protein
MTDAGQRLERMEAQRDAAMQVAATAFRDALTRSCLGDSEPSICGVLGVDPENESPYPNYRLQMEVLARVQALEEIRQRVADGWRVGPDDTHPNKPAWCRPLGFSTITKPMSNEAAAVLWPDPPEPTP